MSNDANSRPACVTALEAAYGAPREGGLGSSVFFVAGPGTMELEELGKAYYQRLVGKEMWDRIGGEQWLRQWGEVYRRGAELAGAGIRAELRGIGDHEARMLADLLLEVAETNEGAREALAQCFEAAAVEDLRIYKMGDGEAISGLLMVGRWENGDTVLLGMLMD